MEIKRSGTYFSILLLFFLICCFTACNDENNMEGMIIPSVEELSLSGEGESALISFTNSNWQIAAISTLDKSFQIWGDIYDLNGKLIHSNTILCVFLL